MSHVRSSSLPRLSGEVCGQLEGSHLGSVDHFDAEFDELVLRTVRIMFRETRAGLAVAGCEYLVELYHMLCGAWPRLQKLGRSRRMIQSHVTEYPINDFKEWLEK